MAAARAIGRGSNRSTWTTIHTGTYASHCSMNVCDRSIRSFWCQRRERVNSPRENLMRTRILLFVLACSVSATAVGQTFDAAKTFHDKCAMCHGKDGISTFMGRNV